jgi:hypothetical protein
MVLVACSGTTADADKVDADTDTDVDADTDAVLTPCPPTVGLQCDRATEVCVVAGPYGPAEQSSCEPVTAGCEGDRTCDCLADALCPNPTDTCTERADNTIYCDNGSQ